MAESNEWLTVPITRHSETVLASLPVSITKPAKDTYRALGDPVNYAHTLDFKEQK